MKTVAITQKQANEFIETLHRHHKPTRGDKFRIGAEVDGVLVGVAQVGRPVARGLDDGKTLEVTRLCTNGAKNACSFLYSKAAKISKELGYKQIITYILETENGASLKASGWELDGVTRGGSWTRESRPRVDKAPICPKQRWIKKLS